MVKLAPKRKFQSHLQVQKKLDTIRKQNVAKHQQHAATQALREDILRAQMQHTYQSDTTDWWGAPRRAPSDSTRSCD